MNAELKERLLRLRWWILHMNRAQIRRWLYKVARPSSYPYISGDGFRRLGRFVYDETNQRIAPGTVKTGDVIFVSTEYAKTFFDEVDPVIRSRYRLITHNSDIPADESLISRYSDKILMWFAQNNTYAHPKVVPVPIGLENLYYYHVGIPANYTRLRTYGGVRFNRILFGFTVATNTRERQRVHEYALRAPCADGLAARLGQACYLERLLTYKFVLAPPGNGLDTHRAWEAMYLGVVPLVKDSVAMRSFVGLGLPLWIVQDWEELLSISEGDLERKYEELKNGFDSPVLTMNYWRRLIRGEDAANALDERTNASQARHA